MRVISASLFSILAGLAAARIGNSVSGATGKIVLQQHEAYATYESAGLSTKGFAVGATWLNEPEVIEIFNVATGNKTVKSIGDENSKDESNFYGAIARDGTAVFVSQTYYFGNDFFSRLYLMDAATSTPGPEWNVTLDTGVALDIDTCADGSAVAVSHLDLNPYLRVNVYRGSDGSPIEEYSWTAPTSAATGGILSMSADGTYVAVLWGDSATQTVHVTVLDDQGHQHTKNVTRFDIDHTEGQAFAISGDGKYVAAAQADTLVVYHMTSASPLTYEELFTFTNTINSFYASSNCVAFAPNAPVLAVGWQAITNPSLQPRMTAWNLPSATPTLNYTFPLETGSYQNWPVGVRVTGDGKYAAFASWGDGSNDPGAQQLQIFETSSAGNSGPLTTFQTPGSMMAVDIAEINGKVMAIGGGKHVHATVMGNGGDLYVIEP